jgi:predicted DNA-binding transcriptional regulator AlpA
MTDRKCADARRSCLPEGALPRGLSREQAAEYVGIGVTLFDQMVRDRRMPRPKQVNTRKVWDRRALDAAFGALPDDGDDQGDVWSNAAV